MTHHDGWLTGCYLVEFRQAEPVAFSDFGTLRVEAVGHGYCASADLYHARHTARGPASPGRPARIPSFPLEDYRFYLRGDGLRPRLPRQPDEPLILEWPFTVFEFAPDSPDGPFLQRRRYTARFRRMPAPRSPAESNRGLRWSGPVVDEHGQVVGKLSADWLAAEYRTARLEILSLDGAPVPHRLANGLDWARVFGQRAVNWSVEVREQSVPRKRLASRSGPTSLAELAWRLGQAKLPAKPRTPTGNHVRLIGAHRLENDLTGVRFDWGAFDVPRACPSITTVVLGTGPRRGRPPMLRARPERERRFREALHELGRALGLRPNLSGDGLMTPPPVSDARAQALPADRRFDPRIRWQFDPVSSHQLRHAPEVFVNPAVLGGPPRTREIRGLLGFPAGTTATGPELELRFGRPHHAVPLGAPVRLNFEVRNRGGHFRDIPGTLSLTSGHLCGVVIGPDTTPVRRPFRAFLVKGDTPPPRALEPGGIATDSLTLFRGPAGALFPQPGVYEVELTIEWCHDDRLVHLNHAIRVEVIPAPADAVGRRLAAKCLAEPELLLCHLLPSDRWKRAGRLLREIAESASPLRDHYAFTNARLATSAHRGERSRGNAPLAFRHLTPDSRLGVAEFRQVLGWIAQDLELSPRLGPAAAGRFAECVVRWIERLELRDSRLLAQAEELVRNLSPVGHSPKTPKTPNIRKSHGQETTSQPLGTRRLRGRTSPRQTGPAARMAAPRRAGRQPASGA